MKRSLCPATGSNPAKSDGMSKSADNSVADRMKHLLSTGTGADCHFLVGKKDGNKELLSAHKSILLSASDVFEAMFRFDAQNDAKRTKYASSVDEISSPMEIIDVEPEAFKAMLSFIYADDLSGLTEDNVVTVLYAANKYNISGLIKACLDCPMPKLNNIFLTFDQARKIGQEDFAHHCLELVDQNANTLLQSEQFLQIDQHLLIELLGRDQLKIDGEIAAWNAALRWADAQCRQNSMECSAANRRAVLGSALDKIRFPLIIQGDFTKHIAPLGVLTSDELVSVYMHYHNASPPKDTANCALPELYPLRFSIERRAQLSKCTSATTWNSSKENIIVLEYENFTKFLVSDRDSNTQNSSTLHLAGYKWEMSASSIKRNNINNLCVQVWCDCASGENPSLFGHLHHRGVLTNWCVKCSLTLRIVSQREGMEDHCDTSNCTLSHFNYLHSWYGKDFLSFKYLMDPQNGFYINDTVILSVEIVVDRSEIVVDKSPVDVRWNASLF